MGALLARFGASLVLVLGADMLPHVNAIAVDARVLAFSCGLAVLIAVALGFLPALRFGRSDLQAGLKEGRGQSADVTKGRLRGALVAVQVGLTLMLFASAGLLLGGSTSPLEG